MENNRTGMKVILVKLIAGLTALVFYVLFAALLFTINWRPGAAFLISEFSYGVFNLL
jgi:hypothetical protein